MIVVRVAQVLLKEPPKYYNLGCHTLKTWQLLHTKAAEGFFRGFYFNSVLKNEGRVFSFYGTHYFLFVCLFVFFARILETGYFQTPFEKGDWLKLRFLPCKYLFSLFPKCHYCYKKILFMSSEFTRLKWNYLAQ